MHPLEGQNVHFSWKVNDLSGKMSALYIEMQCFYLACGSGRSSLLRTKNENFIDKQNSRRQ